MPAAAAARGGRTRLAADEVRPGWAVEIDRDRSGRVLLRLELLHRVDGGGGRIADRGRDLPRQLGPYVTGGVEPGQARLHGRVGHKESQRVVLDVFAVVEEPDVRLNPEENEGRVAV